MTISTGNTPYKYLISMSYLENQNQANPVPDSQWGYHGAAHRCSGLATLPSVGAIP